MKKLSILLALAMLLSVMLAFTSCGGADKKDDSPENEKVDDTAENNDNNEIDYSKVDLESLVAAVNEAAPYDEYVSEFLYKDNDPDEMVCWTYGVIDIKGYELLSDYAITMPTDFCQTLAVLKFEDGMSADDIQEVKDVVTTEYLRARASALQMYMPEEYAKMNWAIENPDAIWRQYGDNLLVLAIYGDSEATAVWDAIDEYLKG